MIVKVKRWISVLFGDLFFQLDVCSVIFTRLVVNEQLLIFALFPFNSIQCSTVDSAGGFSLHTDSNCTYTPQQVVENFSVSVAT